MKPSMSLREEKKRLTRRALMDAALYLVGEGGNFANISLREVARHASVVPTTFYRHFKDMEELGLSLVEEFGQALRVLMRNAQSKKIIDEVTEASASTYMDYVVKNRRLYIFMAQSKAGGTLALRNAIRAEIEYFTEDTAIHLRRLVSLPNTNEEDLKCISSLLVTTVLEMTDRILDEPEDPALSQAYRNALLLEVVKKSRLILLGALHWKSNP